jgi:hypothetical protein
MNNWSYREINDAIFDVGFGKWIKVLRYLNVKCLERSKTEESWDSFAR